MKVFIRADGGENIGLGHIMRMLVLAKELNKNHEVIFLCRSSNLENQMKSISLDNCFDSNFDNDKFKAGIETVIKNGFKVFIINEKYIIEDIVKLQNKYKVDLLITDSYDVDEEYFNKLKLHFKLTGYVDDVNKFKMNVDFIINQNINAEDMHYNCPKDTKLFLGTKYCLLREEFRESYIKKKNKEKVEDVLLTLGGMDNDHNTIKVITPIINCGVNIHVIAGSAFDNRLLDKLYEIAERFHNIKIYENANMSAMMKKCDIAISACGSTLYELCAMNVPTIGIIIADNQKLVGNKMKEKLLILDSYNINEFNEESFVSGLNRLINDNKLRNEIVNNQCNALDIFGVENLVFEISRLSIIK